MVIIVTLQLLCYTCRIAIYDIWIRA